MTDKEIQKLYKQTLHSYEIQDYKEAEQRLEKLIEVKPEHWALYLLQGNILSLLHKDDRAIRSFQRVLKIQKNTLEALNNLAIIHRRQGNFDLAWKILKKTLRLNPQGADLYYNRGNLARAMGKIKRAESDYKKVLELNPHYIQAYNNLGIIHEAREDIDGAAEYYDKGLQQDPQNANLLYNRGVIFQKQKNWDRAEEYFRRALNSRPGWTDCQNNLGIVLQEKGDLPQARKAFHEILHKDKLNAQVLNNMGVVLSQMEQFDEAKDYYQKAIDLEPEYRNASINLNKLYGSQKDFGKSLKEMNRLATLYPFDLEIQNEIGRSLIRLNQLTEAEETFQHILDREPKNYRALQDLAELKVRQGEEEKGWELLQKAGINVIQQQDNEALLRIADAFRKNGNNQRSEELLKRYDTNAPGDQRVQRRLSRIYEEEERWEDALEMLGNLGEDITGDDLTRKIRYNLNQGEKEEALRDMDQLMNMQANRGTEEDLNQFNEFLQLYEETTAAIMDENRDHWEKNINKMARGLQSMLPPKEEPVEDFPLSSFASQSFSVDDSMTLLDINAMEPIIEINEEREMIYLSEEEEDLSDVYTEVMEEERQKKEKDYRNKHGFPPSQMPGYPGPPPQPMYIPVPQNINPPPMQPPMPPAEPPIESMVPPEEDLHPQTDQPEVPQEDELVLEPENPLIIEEETDDVIDFQDEEENTDDELFISDEMEEYDSMVPQDI
ncbi:MAG: tetratricopeptide repeat protein [Spirochaetaceae bacterium]|jgi:tetratricopeptide (TPR) repeat protein|nr:tetratricopeptide repeat protein [Spirochaetaceae bacterium]